MEDIGVDAFEFWIPMRRPHGHNLAVQLAESSHFFSADEVVNGWLRPTSAPNAWAADYNDPAPILMLDWDMPQVIEQLIIDWDVDYDHPMESVLMTHPESTMPFCVKHFRVLDGEGTVLHEEQENHQAQSRIPLNNIETSQLRIECISTHGNTPAAIFNVQCY